MQCSFGVECTWQRLGHAGCKGTNHPQANLLLVMIMIIIMFVIAMIIIIFVMIMMMFVMIMIMVMFVMIIIAMIPMLMTGKKTFFFIESCLHTSAVHGLE